VQKIIDFVKASYDEMKKVQWPTRAETTRLTAYVIGVSLGVGLFVMAFDYVFAHLLTLLITR
jgi:preprotein translocase SecE subunit